MQCALIAAPDCRWRSCECHPTAEHSLLSRCPLPVPEAVVIGSSRGLARWGTVALGAPSGVARDPLISQLVARNHKV